jgi:flavin reductase (DIM6/NTAB) family NADH-FMN oxidoreductase RutF
MERRFTPHVGCFYTDYKSLTPNQSRITVSWSTFGRWSWTIAPGLVPGPEGAAFLQDATAWLDCAIHGEIAAGDHTVVLLSVEAVHARPLVAPLVFHGSRFRRLAA